MRNVYLDYCASTPVDSFVIEQMSAFFRKYYANPSSIHSAGQDSWNALENARRYFAKQINARPEEIYFTSGGTEADNLALQGIMNANKDRGNHLIISSIEHSAIYNTAKYLKNKGFNLDVIGVNKQGFIDLKKLETIINDKTVLISIMMSNNELGTIQNIKAISELCRKKEIFFHTDAVQSFGKSTIDVNNPNIDLMSVSSHKIYGPKGTGFLYVKSGINFEPLFYGGPHEQKKRAGTEGLYNILGFKSAYELMVKNMEKENKKYILFRKRFLSNIKDNISDFIVNSPEENCLANVINISFPGIDSDTMLLELDSHNIFISAGSACSSKSIKVSRVLSACGLSDDIAGSSVRISFGRFTTQEDIDYAVDKIIESVRKLRAMNPEYSLSY